jgi:hypothetical protein
MKYSQYSITLMWLHGAVAFSPASVVRQQKHSTSSLNAADGDDEKVLNKWSRYVVSIMFLGRRRIYAVVSEIATISSGGT